MPGGLREVVLSFKFRQNRLNGFRDLGGQNLPFPILKAVAYITACTTVQAVITAGVTFRAISLIPCFDRSGNPKKGWRRKSVRGAFP